MRKYYGQHNTDKFIHKNYITKPFTNGTFLELGAINGVKFSNTKFFEDNMGFSEGVLIEPEPKSFSQLKRNRPNAKCFNFAIHEFEKETDFLVSDKMNAVGCVKDSTSTEFISRWHKNSSVIKVPCQPLSYILKKSNLKYIDLFSLDVEGAELHCLNTMDWSIPVGLIVVETDQNKEEIDFKLKEHGFTFTANYSREGYYFNFEYFRKKLFSIDTITGLLKQ